MKNDKLLAILESIIGQSIINIKYIKSTFQYSGLHGDWTNIAPDLFVLHSPEWHIELSNGQHLYLTVQESNNNHLDSSVLIETTSVASDKDSILTVPQAFSWLSILDKPIVGFRLWQRIIKTSKFLGREYNFKFQTHYQIIDVLCSNTLFSITLMNGDLGCDVFYPTGYFGNNLGIFFNKRVCSTHTTYGLTMRMADTWRMGDFNQIHR